MSGSRYRAIVLACAACAGLSLWAAAQTAGVIDLGKVAVPADFEHRTRVLLRGDYGLALVRETLSLVHRDPADGMEYSWGLQTTTDDLKEASAEPKVDIAVVSADGQPKIRIHVLRGKKSYTAMLRVSDETAPRPVVKGPIDPAIELELDLVREANAVLRAYATKIWPGWTGYEKLEFLLQFPNRAALIVTGRARVPQAFAALAAPSLDGRRVYLDQSSMLPDPIGGPLSIGAHADISGVTATLTGPLRAAGAAASHAPGVAGPGENAMRLRRMLTYVHEAFHCLQADHAYQREKAGVRRNRGPINRAFDVSLQYNILAEIEGDALLRATMAADRGAAIQHLTDAVVAREQRQSLMPSGAVRYEQLRTRDEGTATFASMEAARLLKASGRPSAGARGNAGLLDAMYANLDGYLSSEFAERMARVKRDSDGTSDRYYVYGAYQVMLLGRLFPGWSTGLFEQDRTIDDVLSERLALTPEARGQAAERFRQTYGIDAVRARHAAALKAREDAIDAIRTRTGRTYRIDLSQAQRGFDINPRPGAVFRGREQLYPFGLISFRWGSLQLVSKETPMRLDGDTLEWVDTDAAAGTKGYDVKYDAKVGDLLQKVTLTTKGFTMTANAARITEDGAVVKIQIID